MPHRPPTSTDRSVQPGPAPDPNSGQAARGDAAGPIGPDRPEAPPIVNSAISILFEDSHCLAIVKPPGQLTQGTWAPPGELTLEAAVRRYLGPSDPASVYLGMVHRLDRPTSGVLLWAKSIKAARRLSAQFERRQVVKEYWAIVERYDSSKLSGSSVGTATRCNETWTDWLTRPDHSGLVSVVSSHTAGAREAVTHVECAAAPGLPPGCAWVRLWPQTGRTHQLRAQATRRGMPILGDADYGGTLVSRMSPGIALHARVLALRHPILNTELKLVAPLPSTWASAGIVLPDQPDATV